MRFQLACAPEVEVDGDVTFLVHPETGARAPVPASFVDVLPYAAKPFTARDLVDRSGAHVSPSAIEHALAELRAIGLVVPASTAIERTDRGAFHPLRLLAIPAVGLALLAVSAVGVAVQLQSVAFFARTAVHEFRGAYVVPVLLAIVVVPAARALFRREVLGGGRVRGRMRGVIPTWEVEHRAPSTKLARVFAHVSGFLFDALLMNACVLTLRTKPFELGYAGIETPVAFLAVSVSVFVVALNPLAKYDAYFALEDALGVADLRGHARARFVQLVRGRRRDPSTIAYAAYFALTIAYSLFISVGLLAIGYAVSSKLFPADAPLRIGLASALIGVVAWRAIQAVHRPVVHAFRASTKKTSTSSVEALALPPPTTLSPSLHPREGFPFAFSLRESVDERTHDFSALAPDVRLHLLDANAIDVDALDLDASRTLSLRMFAQPPRALDARARRALAIAASLERELPLERYEPVPLLGVVDGTFKHGALDVAARMRSASELDVFRALFAPLRSRHVVARDCIDVAFRDRASDRFTHLVVVDENDADLRALRVQGLRTTLERASHRASQGSARDALRALNNDAALVLAARIRRTSPDLLRAAGCVAVVDDIDVDTLAKNDPNAFAWGQSAGLFFAETSDGRTRRASQIRCPTLVVPTGREGSPTGLKLRVLVAEPFDPATRMHAPAARYEFLSPHRNFLADNDIDVGELPVWIADGGAGDTLFVFDGELKAMACRHVLGFRAMSTGGFNHPFAAAIAKHLAREASVTFVVDDESPIYRRARTDQLLDPLVRTLQLAQRVHAIAPSTSLHLMRGLVDDTTKQKLDLDEIAGLTKSALDDNIRKFRANTGDAIDVSSLLSSEVGAYGTALNTFADRFYGALHEIKSARARGSSSEVRALASHLVELEDARKRLGQQAGGARDLIRKALRSRR